MRRAARVRYRQWKIPERVEGDTLVTTRWTLKRWLQLAHEQIDDPRIIYTQITPPRFGSLRLVTATATTQRISYNEKCFETTAQSMWKATPLRLFHPHGKSKSLRRRREIPKMLSKNIFRTRWVPESVVDFREARASWLNSHPVDIFMESLKEIPEEFLRVLLCIAHKTRGVLLNLRSELGWR